MVSDSAERLVNSYFAYILVLGSSLFLFLLHLDASLLPEEERGWRRLHLMTSVCLGEAVAGWVQAYILLMLSRILIFILDISVW
jgi:hypothetical protein